MLAKTCVLSMCTTNILVGTYEGAMMEIDTVTKDITVIMQVGAPLLVPI